MAGGIGSRFWPISRAAKPKQFLDFAAEGRSFLRLTYDRMRAVIPDDNIIVVSLFQYEDLVKSQIPELKDENLVLEPYNRNTAPCLAYVTYKLLKRDPLAVTVVAPADHVIDRIGSFNHTIQSALSYAAGTDSLITLGIQATRPDSNFGYIQMEGEAEPGRPVKVKTFTEKPSEELAKVFIDTGEFLWNSGIFVWKASVIIRELERHIPDITRLFEGWQEHFCTDRERAFIERIYTDMPRLSIDYAVMEKTDLAWVYPAEFEWADIGNWQSLYDYIAYHDENGNATNSNNLLLDDLVKECTGNVIYTYKPKKLMALRGLEDYIVVDTDDVLLICPRDDEKFKDMLSSLAMPEFEKFR